MPDRIPISLFQTLVIYKSGERTCYMINTDGKPSIWYDFKSGKFQGNWVGDLEKYTRTEKMRLKKFIHAMRNTNKY